MDKKLKWFAIIAGSLAGLILLFKVNGMLRYYNIPTPSNEPAVKLGSKIFVSNLPSPETGDIVVFTNTVADSMVSPYQDVEQSGINYIFRLCARENDIVQMKNAVLYINGKNFDENLNLYHYYKIASHNIPYFESIAELEKQANVMQISSDTAIVNLTGEMLKSVKDIAIPELYFLPEETSNPAFHWYHNNQHHWTIDNFGPLKIPAGKAFVLGDNRNNALDSRYIGFINFADISGVKL